MVSIFSDRLARGLSLTIQGDGCQVRDFLYVDDAVAYLTAAMASDHRSSRVFNACTGSATSILHLARHIAAALGKGVDMSHAPARPGDIRTSVGDPGAARQALSIGASVSVADGVARLLASSVTAKSPPVT